MSKCERCGYDFGDSSTQWTMHANVMECVGVLQQEIERLRVEALALRGVIASDDNRLLTAARRVDLDFGCDSAEAMADKVEWLRTENARLRGEYVAAAARLDEARLLAGALLDRVMEVEEVLGCRKDKWKSSLVAKWPWLEDKVAEKTGGGDEST